MATKKVLIIDDDSKNIFALQATLKVRGYVCRTATSADGGMQLMQEDPDIGIVLMDLMLPDRDGYEAIAAIRRHGGLAHVPVIAVTAQAMSGDRERALQAGASAYVSKPVNVDLLLDYLREYLK